MQKKIIALAIAAAISAPAMALADTANVTVYGQANVSYDMTKNGSAGTSANKVSSNISRIGLKGSEDLGNGLNAIWQIESLVNIDGTAAAGNALGGRNTFAGLASDSMGKVILGRHDTPYKLATRGFDQFADNIADNRSLMGAAGVHDTRATDVVAYMSPAMSGFSVAAAYVANAEGVTTAAHTKGSAYSLAAMYDNAGINGAFAYQTIKGGNGSNASLPALAVGDKADAWKIGGGYTMDAINVNAIYEKTTNTVTGVQTKQTNWYLSGKYSFGNDAVKLAYTKAGNPTGAAAADAKQISVGYDHSLSKRTTVYALYTQLSNSAAAAYGLTTGVTGVTGAVAGVAGQKPSAFSVGMKHSF
ncbi:MAG: porin [Nitrosomonadales bacterium]|nr:porin [Nitrosomonadales bacterium]